MQSSSAEKPGLWVKVNSGGMRITNREEWIWRSEEGRGEEMVDVLDKLEFRLNPIHSELYKVTRPRKKIAAAVVKLRGNS